MESTKKNLIKSKRTVFVYRSIKRGPANNTSDPTTTLFTTTTNTSSGTSGVFN